MPDRVTADPAAGGPTRPVATRTPAGSWAGPRSDEAWVAGCRAGDPETPVAFRDLLVRALRAALTGRAPEPDATLTGRGAAEARPLVADHLARCSACRAEFEVLLDALHAIEGDAAVPALA